jgi:hypothetical protein
MFLRSSGRVDVVLVLNLFEGLLLCSDLLLELEVSLFLRLSVLVGLERRGGSRRQRLGEEKRQFHKALIFLLRNPGAGVAWFRSPHLSQLVLVRHHLLVLVSHIIDLVLYLVLLGHELVMCFDGMVVGLT